MAVRTVSVELKMQIADFLRGAGEASAATKLLGHEFEDLGKKSEKFSTAKPSKEMQNFSRVINSSLKDGTTAFQGIQKSIDETKTRITSLRTELKSSQSSGTSAGLFGDLKQAQKDLRTLEGIAKDIEPTTGKISNNLKVAAEGTADFKAELIKAAVYAAPFLVPVAAGSLLGVLGAGGLALGVVGQLKRADVKTALATFGSDVSTTLTKATAPFGPELAKSIAIADAGVTGFLKSLGPAFKALAPELSIFTKTVSGGLLQAGPLFANAMARARPDVQALAGLIADVTVGTGQFFNNLTIGAQGGAVAIGALGTRLKELEGDLGTDLGIISQMVGQLGQWETAANGVGQGTGFWSKALGAVKDSAKQALDPMTQIQTAQTAIGKLFHAGAGSAAEFNGSVMALTGNEAGSGLSAAQALASAYDDLAAAMSSAESIALTLDQAELNLKQAQADLGSTLKKNKDNWNQNTQAGRDDWSQLLNTLGAIQKVHDAQVAQGGATAKNTSAYYANVDALLAIARKAGLSKDAIQKLRDQFEKVPPKKETKVTAPGLSRVLADSGAYNTTLRNIPHSVSTTVTTHYTTIGRPPGQARPSRWGDIYEPAADGLLSAAQVYSPVNPGRFMIAEPQTHGEAFIPKNGDYGRSMSILSAAAGWYGASVVAGNGGGGGSTNITVSAAPGMPREFLNLLRFTVQTNGGNVVQALTPR